MNLSGFQFLSADFLACCQRLPDAFTTELEAQGAAIAATAKGKFGGYQTGWAPLAASTRAERARLGLTPDDPLFRGGQLRDAVHHKVEGNTVFIGVEAGTPHQDAEGKAVDAALVMAVHEYGDSRGHVPPRPVFGTVMLEDIDRHLDAFVLGVLTRTEL